MTTPRIGDTVHYRDESGYGDCLAAIANAVLDPRHVTVRNAINGGTHLNLTIFGATGVHNRVNIPYDTDGAILTADGDTHPSFGGFTPRTWHHIH